MAAIAVVLPLPEPLVQSAGGTSGARASMQVVPYRHLDQGRHVSRGSDRQQDHRHLRAGHGLGRPRESDAIVLRAFTPVLQPTHHPDPGAVAHRFRTVEIGDVEDSNAPDLDVVTDDLRGKPGGASILEPFDSDHVVRHQPMAAGHQLEGGLTLANAARAPDQNANPQDLHQCAVNLRFHAQILAGRRRKTP
jgi:hypothetical protein